VTEVFISYRKIHDSERQRVRNFAERLRECGIRVTLDQFYLDEHPAGPSEGWDKWSSDRALKIDYVIIIGSEAWFQCFDKTQDPGSGLGAACEADDLRHRIYKANGVIENIRVVLFDDDDARHISAKLERYHRFQADNDFNAIVRWLGGTLPLNGNAAGGHLKTSTPHNLPRLQPFFGREKELAIIREALDPEARTWGALIDGPGGMGKTSLAVRAAYDCPPGQFERIIFVSIKDREMDDDGVRPLGNLLIPGFIEMMNELARELGQPEITKSAEDQRIRLLLDALRDKRVLLILDNLESLAKTDRDQVLTFVKRLPQGCKAILTSRRRICSSADTLILEKLDQDAALETLDDLAKRIPLLARPSEAERIALYTQTGGKPLLLRWVAGQLGRGSCRTFTDALAFLRSCPPENDPLEFIFGDLAQEFTDDETKVLCALTYFSLPAEVKHIAANAGLDDEPAETALRSLANRSLVVPDSEERSFALVPMVADFLRKSRPEVVQETGDRLEERAYALIIEFGGDNFDRFPKLEAAWPGVAPALPRFLGGNNARLQRVCNALQQFLHFQGHWDEALVLGEKAEVRALADDDHDHAGWRAYDVGCIHHLRRQADAVLTAAGRAAAHWDQAQATAHERAEAIRLRGLGHELKNDYASAIIAYRESLDLHRSLGVESRNVAFVLNDIATAERCSRDFGAAEGHYRESIRVSQALGNDEGVALSTGNLAALALDREDWPVAETLAREALVMSENVHRQELVALDNHRLAKALVRQGKAAEALPHAQVSVEIYTRLGSPELANAQAILRECRMALAFERLNHGWTYNTTSLEGSTLSLSEVERALTDPAAVIANRPADHVAQNRAQGEALKLLADFLKDDRDLTTDDLFRLHTMLMKGATVDYLQPIGGWKIEDNGTPVKLDGKSVWNDAYAAAHHVRTLMDEWLRELNRRRSGKGDALADHIWLHATFVRIHPFADGNGRMARMLANLPLLAQGRTPVDIPATARERYLTAIAQWQIACGPPRPNEPLFPMAELLADFADLCASSRAPDE